MRVGFTFEGATLDGQPVPASDRAHRATASGSRSAMPTNMSTSGEHRYVIRYRTTRQIGRFEDYDELYWNATGNGWIFPIDVAEARIRLPAPVKFGQRAAYTGPQGSTASNAEVVEEKPGEITFRTTQPLGPYEGLTVAVAFPKGVVAEPIRRPARSAGWLADYGPPVAGRPRPARACRFLLHRLAARRPRSARRARSSRSSRRPTTCRPAAMRYVDQDGRRQPRLRRRAGRHGRSAATSAWSRRMAAGFRATRRGIERLDGHDAASARGGSGAAAALPDRRIDRDGAEESREIFLRQEQLGASS